MLRGLIFFLLLIHPCSYVYSAYPFHLQREGNRICNFALYAACNYPESHWSTSHPAWPDSLQIVYWYRYPGSDLILVVQTWLYYISYSFPFIHCVPSLLLGKICKAVEFDPSQNKLRCTVLAALSSRAIQQLREAMLCWLDLSAHLAPHLHNGPLFLCAAEETGKVCFKFHRISLDGWMYKYRFTIRGYYMQKFGFWLFYLKG